MNKRVKELRKALGLSGQKFGEQLGITRSAVSNIENGNRNLTEQNIKAICREFNVNDEWIRKGLGKMFINISDEDKLMAWAGSVLSEKDGNFKKSFMKMLMNLSEEHWIILEEKVKELAQIKKVD